MSLFTTLVTSKFAMTALVVGAIGVGGTAAAYAAQAAADFPTAAFATETPGASDDPTATPEPTESPEPTATPEPTESPEPTGTPEPTAGPTGPDATGAAAFGLCNAFSHGGLGPKSVARAALVKAAGGEAAIPAYCSTIAHPGKPSSEASETTDEASTDDDSADEQSQPSTSKHASHGASRRP